MTIDLTHRPLQELFTESVERVVAQGSRAYDEEAEICLYRTPDGRGCAVGVLLTNEEARSLTRSSVGVHIYNGALRTTDEQRRLLQGLQNAHDEAYLPDRFVRDFVFECRRIAKSFDLEMPASTEGL